MGIERHLELEKEFGEKFQQVCGGGLSVAELYKWGTARQRDLVDVIDWDNKFSDILLKNALDFIAELHDEETVRYYQSNLEEIRSFADDLNGKQTQTYLFQPAERVRVEISYL